MDTKLWHYDYLDQWNESYYKDVFLQMHLTGDEVAIGKEDEREFYYVAKKDKQNYLIPSDLIEKGEIPFKALNTYKIGYRGKAYIMISEYKCIAIRAEKSMSYKQLINSWMDYEHEEKDRFTLWKIIVDAAYVSRINVRVLTYPGWMKDSVLFSLSRLRGNCSSINKPSIAKLKYLLTDTTQVLGLNEIQKLDDKNKSDLASFYEDIGDFKTEYINPTRAASGATEMCKISNLSTLTFSNFPSSKKSVEEQQKELFDNIFDPKIRSRIFPILFKGGTEIMPACKQRFGHITEKITQPEVDQITDWLRNHRYYENNWREVISQKNFKKNYFIGNTRWDRNFQAISDRIMLYSETQEEFDKFTKLLYYCHLDYLEYMKFEQPQPKIAVQDPTDTFAKFKAKEEKIAETPEEFVKRVKEFPFEDLAKVATNVDEVLEKMLKRGDIFEISPGKYKILE